MSGLRGRARLLGRHLRRSRIFDRVLLLKRGGQLAVLDYPVRRVPRFAFPDRAYPELNVILASRRQAYTDQLRAFLQFARYLQRIPARAVPRSGEPGWINGWQPGLDCAALYGLTAIRNPARYLEIGSGTSTKFVRRAISDHSLETRITSIDPQPRAEVDPLCDRVVRTPLQDVDLGVFGELTTGDMVFFDGSHRCLMNSDVSVFFLEVLPRLPAGVLVGIHDVWLPYDYPEEVAHHLYSEQYLLAVDLLVRGNADHVVLPGAFVSADRDLKTILEPLWQEERFAAVERHGCGFWMLT
jgi:hypothetical protein